jgi:hypothetical protein
MDILDRDLKNQVDVLSDTNQILDDIIGQFRLSVEQSLGCFNAKYYLDEEVVMTPFLEQYTDMCGGWNGVLKIKVMTPLDRCSAAFDTFDPDFLAQENIDLILQENNSKIEIQNL